MVALLEPQAFLGLNFLVFGVQIGEVSVFTTFS